jgi:tripartite-type tricarboxylate transporter receptor subunit TctC
MIRGANTIKNLIACAATIVIAAVTTVPAMAQYPSKPIRIVLQFPAGGATDAAARILGQALTQSMGQPVLVENRPGADGAIAADVVAKAAPDGYTVFLASNTPMMQVPLLRKNPPYDPTTDFTPITDIGRYIFILVVDPALPVKSVAELVAYARANPGKLNFGSFSSVGQLMFAQMRTSTNTDMVLIPYKGEAPTVVDVLAGRTHFTFATPASTLAHIKDGKLRPLAILLSTRSGLLPEVPTTVEAGMAPFSVATFVSLFGPARMPSEIVARLNKEFNAAMRLPGMREQIERQGVQLTGSTPDELGSFIKQQLDAWGRAFREAGMKPE